MVASSSRHRPVLAVPALGHGALDSGCENTAIHSCGWPYSSVQVHVASPLQVGHAAGRQRVRE